jgi:DNA-binding transcriptional LysR family regulator
LRLCGRTSRRLPIALPPRPWPIVLVTLKRRTLNPVAQRFIEHLRGCMKTLAAELGSQQGDGPTRAKR